MRLLRARRRIKCEAKKHMKPLWILMASTVFTTIFASPTTQPATAPVVQPASTTIRVAIYDDGGGSHIGPENVEKCLKLDAKQFDFRRVTAQDIRGGALAGIDVLVQP